MKTKKNGYISFTLMMVILTFTGYIFTSNGIHEKCYDLFVSVINSVDNERYKEIMQESVAAIKMTYDSGLRGAGIRNGQEMMLFDLLGFDSNEPLSVIKAYLPYVRTYDAEIKIRAAELSGENDSPGLNSDDIIESESEEEFEYIPDNPEDGGVLPTSRPDKDSVDNKNNKDNKDNKVNPYEPKFNDDGDKLSFINTAGVSFNADSISTAYGGLKFDDDGVQIAIYSTHTHEGYLNSGEKGVVRVGDVLKKTLNSKHGIKTIHNGTIHDTDFNASYNKSYNTMTGIQKGNRNIKMYIDVHRDAAGSDKRPLKVAMTHNGQKYARLMFVVGTNVRLTHPNWKKNMGLVIRLQKELNVICPGIARPIYISPNRYNQHVSPGAVLIEVGASGNDLEECLRSAKILAAAINNISE